jgi:hypothetical protein
MKKILIIALLVFTGVAFGQSKAEVDQRLVENHGDDIYRILSSRKDYYKFLMFELNSAYEIVELNDLNNPTLFSVEGVQTKSGELFSPSDLINPSSFNFMKYNFERQKDIEVLYDLGNGKVLRFKSLMQVAQEFRDSGLNTKS